jgi:hypothetical protein
MVSRSPSNLKTRLLGSACSHTMRRNSTGSFGKSVNMAGASELNIVRVLPGLRSMLGILGVNRYVSTDSQRCCWNPKH